MILIVKDKIYCANVGDSRSILCYKNNKLQELSHDHKPQLDKEKERIEKAGGFVADNRINGSINLSRAIGDLEYKKDVKLKQDEQIIISRPDITIT